MVSLKPLLQKCARLVYPNCRLGTPKIKFQKSLVEGPLYISTKPYWMERSLSKGLEDLRDLCIKQALEGAWLYDGTGIWYSMTVAAGEGIDGRLYCINLDFDYSRLGKDITDYHIHPDHASKNEGNEGYAAIKKMNLGEKLNGIMDKYGKLQSHILPSTDDIEIYAGKIQRHANSRINLHFRIVSSYGITDIELGRIGAAAIGLFCWHEVLMGICYGLPFLLEAIPKGISWNEVIQKELAEINRKMAGKLRLEFFPFSAFIDSDDAYIPKAEIPASLDFLRRPINGDIPAGKNPE